MAKAPPLLRAVLSVYVLLAAAFVLPRFLYLPSLCSRAHECLERGRPPTGPFRADASMELPRVCGDLSRLSNEPELCDPRPERFETDPWGYRNDRPTWAAEPDVLLFGDSFGFGEGTTQALGPAPRLAAALGRPVYDGAGKLELNYLRWLLEHRARPPARIAYLYVERHFHDASGLGEWDAPLVDGWLARQNRFWRDFAHYDPLEIAAAKLDKRWFTPGLWPNRFASAYPVYRLTNGRPILFLPEDIRDYGKRREDEVPKQRDYFAGLSRLCESLGSRLTVVLVPDKYDVYGRLLEAPPKPPAPGPAYLDRLAEALDAAGVDNVPLLPALREAAPRELASGRLLYYADDTHWNERGIELAMRLVAAHWSREESATSER